MNIGVPYGQCCLPVRIGECEIQRNQAAHGMTESDERCIGIELMSIFIDSQRIGNHLFPGLAGRCLGKGSKGRIRCNGLAMPTMVMGKNGETGFAEKLRKWLIACGMFRQTMVDLYDGACAACGPLVQKVEGSASG